MPWAQPPRGEPGLLPLSPGTLPPLPAGLVPLPPRCWPGPGCTHRCCSCCSPPAAPSPPSSGRLRASRHRGQKPLLAGWGWAGLPAHLPARLLLLRDGAGPARGSVRRPALRAAWVHRLARRPSPGRRAPSLPWPRVPCRPGARRRRVRWQRRGVRQCTGTGRDPPGSAQTGGLSSAGGFSVPVLGKQEAALLARDTGVPEQAVLAARLQALCTPRARWNRTERSVRERKSRTVFVLLKLLPGTKGGCNHSSCSQCWVDSSIGVFVVLHLVPQLWAAGCRAEGLSDQKQRGV